jgi:hypothetical protein
MANQGDNCFPFLACSARSAKLRNVDLAEVFAKVWANLRATRSVLGETRIRSAMTHMAVGAHKSRTLVGSKFQWPPSGSLACMPLYESMS